MGVEEVIKIFHCVWYCIYQGPFWNFFRLNSNMSSMIVKTPDLKKETSVAFGPIISLLGIFIILTPTSILDQLLKVVYSSEFALNVTSITTKGTMMLLLLYYWPIGLSVFFQCFACHWWIHGPFHWVTKAWMES